VIILSNRAHLALVILLSLVSTPIMNYLEKFGDLVSPNDPELVEKTLVRME
jgi:hypothetical protein